METGSMLNYILSYLMKKIIVPTEFHDQAESVEEMLKDDVTGMIDSLTDFAVDSASVDFAIETDNEKFTEILKKWLGEINIDYRGKIPSGIKALSKEYFRERWKRSSFPVLRIAEWKTIDGIEVPSKMFFVDGKSIHAKDKSDSADLQLINYDYYLGTSEELKLDDDCIFAKPYGRWFDKYPTPYLIKRGIYHNFKIIQSLKNKQTEILDQIIPYLLLIKKGTKELATEKIKTYSNSELQAVITQFQELVDEIKDSKFGESSTKGRIRATNFDEEIKHLIPDLEVIFKTELFSVAERNILAGLGFIDVIDSISSSRRESVLNPKVFMEEVNDGVEDFKQIMKELIMLIKKRNIEEHRKYFNEDFYISSSPVTSFMTDKFKQELRLLWKNGGLSDKTYCEMVGEVDFETEKLRRKKEVQDGTEILMYPHITQNREEQESFEEIKRQKMLDDKEAEDKHGTPLPPDKTEEEQKDEYDVGMKFNCECIKCGHKQSSDKHCKDLKCSECGGTMRRIERPGKGQPKKSELEGAPYKKIKDLPKRVKDSMSLDLQRVFLRVFNNAYETYQDDSRAFRIAWGVIKKMARRNKKGIWVRKSKKEKGKKVKVKLTRAMIEEVLEKEENEAIDSAIKEKKLELLESQNKLAKKLLKDK